MPRIDPVRLKSSLGAAAGRFDVDSVDLCDSTNNELLRRAGSGAVSGSVLVADEQTAGRGRRGRSWLSDADGSLTFSALWRFGGPSSRLSGLSLAVGVAVARALDDLGVQGVGLKWPNDVLLQGAKLAGILVELASDRRGTQAVIGIGINLHRPSGDLPNPAAGLSDILSALPDRHAILAALLASLAGTLDRFAESGFAGVRPDWQARHAWQGLPVNVMLDDAREAAGICQGADDDGALLVATPGGLQRYLSGDLSLRRS